MKESSAFGYLDPSAMMTEYLYNYRNFLEDLRQSTRKGKNYEYLIEHGISSPGYSPFSRLNLEVPSSQAQVGSVVFMNMKLKVLGT